MKPIYLITKHFLQSTFKKKEVYYIAGLVVVLMLYAAFTGWRQYSEQTEIRLKYQAESRKAWESNPDKHPHRMSHFGNFAFRPKPLLSIIDFGMESFVGNSIFLEPHVQNSSNFSEASFSTGLLRFGEISMTMIWQTLFPLLLFFLGFASIVSERENGTLKILLSQGISPHSIILGKSWGLWAVAMILFMVAIVPCILLFFLLNPIIEQASQLFPKLLIMAGAYTVFLFVISLIAVLVSAWSVSSKASLVSLIGIWLVFTIIIPRASQTFAEYVHKTPTKVKFLCTLETETLKQGDSHNPDDPHFKAFKDSILAHYKVKEVVVLPVNYSGLQMREGERISSEIYQNHKKQLSDTYQKQNNVSKWVALLNPYMAIKNVSMAVANTDYANFVHFEEQAEQYRYYMAQRMNELQIEHISNEAKTSADKRHILSKSNWAAVKDFDFKTFPLRLTLQNQAFSAITLLLWVGGLLLFTFFKSKNIHVL